MLTKTRLQFAPLLKGYSGTILQLDLLAKSCQIRYLTSCSLVDSSASGSGMTSLLYGDTAYEPALVSFGLRRAFPRHNPIMESAFALMTTHREPISVMLDQMLIRLSGRHEGITSPPKSCSRKAGPTLVSAYGVVPEFSTSLLMSKFFPSPISLVLE